MSACAHIVPVGTSLLGNFGRDPEGSRLLQGLGLSGADKLPPGDSRQEAVCRNWEVLKGELLEFAGLEGERASAELNSLLRASQGLGCEPGMSEVILYATDSCNSRLCMEVIAEYLRGLGFIVTEKVIRAAASEDELDKAMAEVVDEVLREVPRLSEKHHLICSNATPGFKAEAAYFTVASLLAGIPCIYYYHEAFVDVVYLPAPPLQLSKEHAAAILELSTPKPQELARKLVGTAILRDLIDRKLVYEKEGVLKAREWAVRLAKLALRD